MTQMVEVGSIVRYLAPGSRNTDGEARRIPAVVTGQWLNGCLQLYALHFEGAFLVNAVPPEEVEMVFSRSEFFTILERQAQRITELENRVAALSGQTSPLRDRFLDAEIHDTV